MQSWSLGLRGVPPPATESGYLPPPTIRADSTARHRAKYESGNPVQRWLIGRLQRRCRAWLDRLAPRTVLDVGCGEGYFWEGLARWGPLPKIVGIDLRADAVEAARERLPGQTFLEGDLFDLDPKTEQYDLVVASEVLEHLYDPDAALRKICQLTRGWVLLTVPHEPWFQACNLLRGRDLTRWGNHPEHVQRWTGRGFRRFAEGHLFVQRTELVFPFVVLVALIIGSH